MNAFVTELLERTLASSDERRAVSARIDAGGLRVTPRPAGHPRSRDETIAMTRGAGTTASEALAADRNAR